MHADHAEVERVREKAKYKLVRLSFLPAFWIARFGDWLYLFDYPSGSAIGRPILCPRGARNDAQ